MTMHTPTYLRKGRAGVLLAAGAALVLTASAAVLQSGRAHSRYSYSLP